MNGKRRNLAIAVALSMMLLYAAPGWSLRTVARGNRPVQDRGRRWPAGTVNLANLKSRLGYWARYEHVFLYRCKDTDEFNEALKTFAVINANTLELVVHNGPKYSWALKDKNEELAKEDNRVDWTFTVWSPERWDMLYNRSRRRVSPANLNFGKPVAPPRIDAYIIRAGSILWEQVKVPENVVLIDKRPGSVSPEFAGKGLVRATVFDIATKKPIAGAEVVLLKRHEDMEYKQVKGAKTDEKGFCQIAQIPPGYYQIKVHADGYAARYQGNWNNELPEYLKFTISLARPESVKGVVVDEAGKPVKGVKVSARDVLSAGGFGYSVGDLSSTTDNLGRFKICSLPRGLISIRCEPTTVHLKNSIFEQYPVPSDNIKLVVTGTATIWGKVVDKDGKRPAGGIVLKLKPEGGNKPGSWGGSWTLSADGSFKMTGIPPGKYVISTRPNPGSSRFEPNAETITVKAGKTYEMEVLHEDVRDRIMNKIRKFIERRLKNEQ
jgi:5-hydroxyisourate hydrolase-like protein (transthyretin family)